MKKLLTIIATVLTGFVISPTTVEAQHHRYNIGHSSTYVSGHTSCGCAIHTKRVISGYDCNGYPVYRYYRQPVTHRCRHHGNHNSYHRNTHHSSYRGYAPSYRSSSRSHRGHSSFTFRTSNGCISFGR